MPNEQVEALFSTLLVLKLRMDIQGMDLLNVTISREQLVIILDALEVGYSM